MGFRSLFGLKKKPNNPTATTTKTTTTTTTTDSPSKTLLGSRSSSANSRATHVEELEQVFKKFDANGDGKISAAELGLIVGSLGQSATEDELQKMVRVVDKDGDGFIDLEEFIELNTKGVGSDEALASLKDAFSVYDIDGNGSITAEELHKVMRSLGEECSMAECRRMISGVDCDGDGVISFDEFKEMMMMGSRFDAMETQRVNNSNNNVVKIE